MSRPLCQGTRAAAPIPANPLLAGRAAPLLGAAAKPWCPGRQDETGLMELITSTDALAAFCARAADFDFVTVDTEFLRETTYWPKLCLLQAATPDEAVLVDPLAPGLEPRAVLRRSSPTRSVTKVFHAARQDIEIFVKLSGRVPEEHLRHPGRRQRLRLWRQRQLRQPRPRRRRRRSRQVLPLHRLVAPAADRKAEDLRARRRHPPPRHLSRAAASRSTRPTAGTGSRTRWRSSARSTPTSSSPSRPGNGSR